MARQETYCPRCGRGGLSPTPGGINEYDSRSNLLPLHQNPNGGKCIETTTPDDAKKFLENLKKAGLPEDHTFWPALKEEATVFRTPQKRKIRQKFF